MSVLEQGYLLGEYLLASSWVRCSTRGTTKRGCSTRDLQRGRFAVPTRPRVNTTDPSTPRRSVFDGRTSSQQQSHYDWTDPDRAVSEARAAELPITAGPVIDLAADTIPEWALKWRNDLPTLAAFMCDFLETVINRYKGDIRRWVISRGSITSMHTASMTTPFAPRVPAVRSRRPDRPEPRTGLECRSTVGRLPRE